jgi:hypothetical protein
MISNFVYYAAVGTLIAAAFCTVGAFAIGALMLREIVYYRALKNKHAQNVKRLADKLPMWRDDAKNKDKEREALRKLSTAIIGYCSRLEKHLRACSAPSYADEVIGSGPPIFAAIEAIRANDWKKYEEIMGGYALERMKKS